MSQITLTYCPTSNQWTVAATQGPLTAIVLNEGKEKITKNEEKITKKEEKITKKETTPTPEATVPTQDEDKKQSYSDAALKQIIKDLRSELAAVCKLYTDSKATGSAQV